MTAGAEKTVPDGGFVRAILGSEFELPWAKAVTATKKSTIPTISDAE